MNQAYFLSILFSWKENITHQLLPNLFLTPYEGEEYFLSSHQPISSIGLEKLIVYRSAFGLNATLVMKPLHLIEFLSTLVLPDFFYVIISFLNRPSRWVMKPLHLIKLLSTLVLPDSSYVIISFLNRPSTWVKITLVQFFTVYEKISSSTFSSSLRVI